MSFSGKGRIAILTGEDTSKASPADKVGCLDEYGQFTSSLSDCAVFTHHEAVAAKGFDGYLSTSVGNCTWWYSKRPANTDSKYGKNTRAFECGESVDFMENNDYTYTVVSTILFLNHGNCIPTADPPKRSGHSVQIVPSTSEEHMILKILFY